MTPGCVGVGLNGERSVPLKMRTSPGGFCTTPGENRRSHLHRLHSRGCWWDCIGSWMTSSVQRSGQ